ncbi:MAG: glycosyltransferase family 4 protein [Pseudomonadales bacterium]|nr:glycosyltransferase family 4 protein [Pseudomonadales bacterium]
MSNTSIYFAFPGDLDTASGGYHYDRRLIAELRELGLAVELVALPHCNFPLIEDARSQVVQVLAKIPDHATIIIDGLAYGVLDEVAAAEAERLLLIALCHHPLALETGHSERERQLLFESERRALGYARLTLVTSEHTRQILIDQFGMAPETVIVARPGTDRVEFAACEGNPPQLLTLASLTRRKAHDVLIEALARISVVSWQARFVGSAAFDPDWAIQLQEQAARLGLSERIDFAGEVDDAQAEYQRADMFVLPSRYEGYGMVFAEAIAAGLPVVGASAGAVPEVVPPSAGLLVPPDDAYALADALHRLLNGDTVREGLQAGARSAAASLPQWADSASIVAKVLREVQR